ncbi:MAG: DUF309 domain-containing protein [Terriglobales bacterium]
METTRGSHEIEAGDWLDSIDYQRGLDVFNDGRYFDAHEILEDVWRESKGNDRRFLQGLIQIAVALHHYANGNLAGAKSVFKRAEMNLASYPEGFGALYLAELRATVTEWRQALENGAPSPAPIKFRHRRPAVVANGIE